MLFLLLTLLSLFFLTSSPLHYALLLVAFSTLIVRILVSNSVIPGVLGFLILLVYLGAIIILLAYVCAVVPNLHYNTSLSFTNLFLFFSCLTLFLVLNLFTFIPSSESLITFNLARFFYSIKGVIIFFLVVIIMLVILYTTSTTSQVSRPIRSSS